MEGIPFILLGDILVSTPSFCATICEGSRINGASDNSCLMIKKGSSRPEELSWLGQIDNIDVSFRCCNHEQLVPDIHRVILSWQKRVATAVDCRRSQYFTVLSQEPVTIIGAFEFGIWKNRRDLIGALWAATCWAGAPSAPRSRRRAVLSAPAPATFRPSCRTCN